jgi:hypothetical protein
MLNLSNFNRILKFELCHYVNISQTEPRNRSRAGAAPSRTSALKRSRVRAAAGAAGEPRGTRAPWVQSQSATRRRAPSPLCAALTQYFFLVCPGLPLCCTSFGPETLDSAAQRSIHLRFTHLVSGFCPVLSSTASRTFQSTLL